jgi:D-apionolactonase
VCLSAMDPRQRGLFNAAWMLAYVAACARSGVEAVALGAPTGQFGHIYRRTDFGQPWYDGLDAPAVYPGFHVFADLARLGGESTPGVDVKGAGVAALAVKHAGRHTLWVANLTADPVAAEIAAPAGRARIALLDAGGFEQMACDANYLDAVQREVAGSELTLDAYGLARIVWQ